MALLQVMNQIQKSLGLSLQVLHIHHGDLETDSNNDQTTFLTTDAAIAPTASLKTDAKKNLSSDRTSKSSSFRDQAQALVQTVCQDLKIPNVAVKSEAGLKTEAECRKFRRDSLLKMRSQAANRLQKCWLMTAHHQQDLLETRMLRLIRGTGPQGLKAIHARQDPWVRPWLQVTTEEISNEIEISKIDYVQDPSNNDSRYLRNWVRNTWLKSLEKHQPGAVESLGRSLENLAQLQDKALEPVWVTQTSFKRGLFHTLTPGQKRQVLATCLHRVVGSDYSLGQIEEIQKQLDKSQSEHTFKMKNSLWKVNAQHVSVRKDS